MQIVMSRLVATVFIFLMSIYGIQAQASYSINSQQASAHPQKKQFTKKILISKVIDHKALYETIRGIIEGLAQNGYKQGQNLELHVESSQGSQSLAAQIASKFVSQNPDVLVAVGTISAQSFLKHIAQNKKLQLVFSSVSDPKAARLTNVQGKSTQNISGVSNFIDLKSQIELFTKLQPNLKRLGILYNTGEANSVTILGQLIEVCRTFGIEIVTQTASRTSEIAQATAKLASNVDAIFINNDNTALNSIKIIISVSAKHNVPVYVSDTDCVEFGALAALGANQYKLGLQTAEIISKILDGVQIEQIPIAFPNETVLFINYNVASKFNIKISEDLMSKAVIIGMNQRISEKL
ncbi:ABC transporter substrate-binding protein [Candidatus Lariskella endosymbiont of Hedychridium roseum]|uniref:ABC transporter substrate-binding protein n=1 Tax=Candidatus Lariskella endosymbiont of Hedychridium roseum TaxID=3077949 RepID=UPI0030CBA99D